MKVQLSSTPPEPFLVIVRASQDPRLYVRLCKSPCSHQLPMSGSVGGRVGSECAVPVARNSAATPARSSRRVISSPAAGKRSYGFPGGSPVGANTCHPVNGGAPAFVAVVAPPKENIS